MPIKKILEETRAKRSGTLGVELHTGDRTAGDCRGKSAAMRCFKNGIAAADDRVTVHEVGLRAVGYALQQGRWPASLQMVPTHMWQA